MHAVRVNTLVDKGVVAAIPELRPFLGRKVELIALEAKAETGQQLETNTLGLDEFIATRPKWPTDRPAITLEQMDQAIAQGALHSAGV